MRKLTPEKRQEIQQIIDDIKSGKKEHDQSRYHCGTTHCIAGWLFVNALERAGMSTAFTYTGEWIDSNGEVHDNPPNPLDPYQYVSDFGAWAANYLNIDEQICWQYLFYMLLPLHEIEENLDLYL